MKELLEVLRVQRHNFLNHLQVISGLIQLKKYERVSEYIRQIGDEYNQASLISRIEIPEIVSAVLVSELALSKQGIALNKKICTNLEKGIKDAKEAGEILQEATSIVAAVIKNTGNSETVVDLKVDEQDQGYNFQVSFSGAQQNIDLIEQIKTLKEKAKKIEADVCYYLENGHNVIKMQFESK